MLGASLNWARPARPAGGVRTLTRRVVVRHGLQETFRFFADAANLQRITPEWLDFRILTPLPIEMKVGAELQYVIRLHGIPIRWRTVIDAWEPGVRFVDRQVAGPYRWWHHEHRFRAVAEGTEVEDRVEYAAPFAWLTEPLLVRRDLRRIFDHRSRAIVESCCGGRERGR